MTGFESLTGYSLADPGMLLVLLLVPLALAIRYVRGVPTVLFSPAVLLRKPKSGRGDDPLAAPLPVSWRVRLLGLPRGLQVAGLVVAGVALARPVERVPLPVEREGIDILLCLDLSSSMLTDDLDPVLTRLDIVKEAASAFIESRPDDRIGLVGFARYPDLRCPLTMDHEALLQILGELATVDSDGPEDATGIGTAVARSIDVLRTSEAKSKVVILLTDGEENVASERTPEEIAPLHAAQLGQQWGVRVYSIAAGIGRRDATGKFVDIDTSQIQSLAVRTGGVFFKARDASTLGRVYEAIDALEKAQFEEPRYELEERFLVFLAVAVGLLVVSRVLAATVLEVLP